MEHFQKPLYWHIRKLVIRHEDADDVLQNTYIKVWKGLENFRGEAKIYTWLYRIATNEALGFLRSKRETQALGDSHWQAQSDPYFEGEEAERLLWEAIDQLPTKQRAVFIMKYFDDKTYDEMEEILGTSTGALKASYHHATQKIKAYVKAKEI